MTYANVINEPVKNYKPGSEERKTLLNEYDRQSNEKIEIPIIIGGKKIYSDEVGHCVSPHNHKKVLATFHKADEKIVYSAIESSLEAWKSWSSTSLSYRTTIFRKAAKLLAGKWRDKINAATMLNQSKNVYQAEIDAACELIDFFNFNSSFAENIYNTQNLISPEGMRNHLEYRPLEGFVFAIAPFNFTSIAGNLPGAPALMGNVSIWKPASSAILACHYLLEMLKEAGLPDGVINFLPGDGRTIGDSILNNSNLAGVHFTGSTSTFNHIWKTIGSNIHKYKTYPRIVGETGGKDFIMVHPSANIEEVSTAIIRGAFEFQGQKCSAASRVYLPRSIGNLVLDRIGNKLSEIKMGPPSDFKNFITAVIHRDAFDRLKNVIQDAKSSKDAKILYGGDCDDSVGYFVEPTVLVTTNPKYITMEKELFGPIVTVYIYDDNDYSETLKIVDTTSEYALTGAIFAKDRYAIKEALHELENSAGNFYINDKPSGAVVGQQPFGGARASGTNDKAGSKLNLLRWVSPRLIKEPLLTPKDYKYPFLG